MVQGTFGTYIKPHDRVIHSSKVNKGSRQAEDRPVTYSNLTFGDKGRGLNQVLNQSQIVSVRNAGEETFLSASLDGKTGTRKFKISLRAYCRDACSINIRELGIGSKSNLKNSWVKLERGQEAKSFNEFTFIKGLRDEIDSLTKSYELNRV